MGRLSRRQLVVSCEHASNAVPRELAQLGLPARVLEQHVAWDPGAAEAAREAGRRLGAPVHLGRWSRLVVDLNRSERHLKLCAELTFGIRVPGNAALAREDVEARIARWWRPYREAVLADVRQRVRREGGCVHFSSHSFTPEVDGVERKVDVGLLYDPSRPLELAMAGRLTSAFGELAPTLRVRRNQPYRGTADGFVTSCRRLFPPSRYCGFEIELNQRLLRTKPERAAMARLVAGALEAALN